MRKTTVLAGAADAAWKSGTVSRNGLRRSYRVNAALRHATDTGLYPFRLEAAVKVARPDRAGLPVAADTRRLKGIEEEILAAVADRAVLTAVATAAGRQVFVFYTQTADWVTSLERQLRKTEGDVPATPVSISCDPDAGWETYRSLLKDRRRTVMIAVPALVVLPFIMPGIVLGTYGPAWAAGEFGVQLAWLGALVLLLRKGGVNRALAHPVLTFGIYSVLFALLLFGLSPLIAYQVVIASHLGVAAWVALIISVLAGAALTGAVWKAQLRYLRERVGPDRPGAPAGSTSPAAS